MTTRRMGARRVEEERVNEEIPSQVEQVLQDGQDLQGVQVSQGEQVSIEGQGYEFWVNALESTMTSRRRDFVRMNPPLFLGSKMEENPQEFLDGVYKDSAPKVKIEDGSGSRGVKPTFLTCGKKHFRKYLASTGGCFGCGKDGHNVRDCPTIAYRGIEAKQARSSVLEGNGSRKNHFYALRAK
ncbi:hypothetical protein EJD97_024244 [Solanum chilense]|uniref:CCHC-type domain-containing protein n=1 Tax=Solanum chilense TaxID=4083 RepID=A0A6N2C582_SOLCI|nr:hypothetical protein EJD97_024244 [Solanum chilense]